jgi:hypothetical protein
MAKRRDVVAEQLEELAQSLEDLWRAATQDPNKQARRERMWGMLVGALGAASTMASRRVVAKLWPILTGEAPPNVKVVRQTTPPSSRSEEAERPAEAAEPRR